MPALATPQGDLSERIIAAVSGAKKPVTLKGLEKLVKARGEELRAAIEGAVNGGQIYRWSGGRSQSYWSVSSDEKVRGCILAAAGGHALSRAELSKAAAKGLPSFSGRKVEPYVAALAAEKQLQIVPAFEGRSKLYIRSGDREAYVKAANEFVEAKIRAAGFVVERQAAVAATADAGALMLEAVRSLEPVRGVPVSTLRLRNYLRDLSKQEFDSAALGLRGQRMVILSHHADPHNRTAEERETLIDGGDGNYYVAVALT